MTCGQQAKRRGRDSSRAFSEVPADGVVQIRVATPEPVASWDRSPNLLRIKTLGRGTEPDSLTDVATLVGADLNDAPLKKCELNVSCSPVAIYFALSLVGRGVR